MNRTGSRFQVGGNNNTNQSPSVGVWESWEYLVRSNRKKKMFYWTLGIVKLPAINCSKNTIIGSAGLGRARRPWRAEPGRVVSRIAAPAPCPCSRCSPPPQSIIRCWCHDDGGELMAMAWGE